MIIEKPNLENLRHFTEVFFGNHWKEEKLGLAPSWSAIHTDFRKIPNYDKHGVYAFVKGDEIIYIGVGTSRCGGLYRGNGLSARVRSIVVGLINQKTSMVQWMIVSRKQEQLLLLVSNKNMPILLMH